MHWLINPEILEELHHATKIGLKPTAAQVEAFFGDDAPSEETPRILTVAGSEAEIAVDGLLMPRRRFFFMSGTSYAEINASLDIAERNPDVKRVTLAINSPGGLVDGLFATLAKIESFPKQIVARVQNAHSAAYAIAAMADRIEAVNAASGFGSIGIATSRVFFDMEEIVNVTNTKSPDKMPDIRTEEGKAVVRRELDEVNDLFVGAISRGRTAAGKPITAAQVNEAYGSGASFLATEARRRKMVDSIGAVGRPRSRTTAAHEEHPVVATADADHPNEDPAEAPASGTETAEGGREQEDMNEKIETPKLTLAILKAQHPEIYEAARAEGVTAEQKRATAHLRLGRAAGDEGMKIATKAIAEGTAFADDVVQSEYLAAAMGKRDRDDRQAETDVAAGAVAGAPAAAAADAASDAGEDKPDMGDLVVAKLGWDKRPAASAS